MIANSNAGKNMNVTTTAANSVVANSTNINSRIISTLDGHPRFFMSRHSKTWPNYYQFTVMSLQTWRSARYCVHISISVIALAHTLGQFTQFWKLADGSAPQSTQSIPSPFTFDVTATYLLLIQYIPLSLAHAKFGDRSLPWITWTFQFIATGHHLPLNCQSLLCMFRVVLAWSKCDNRQ